MNSKFSILLLILVFISCGSNQKNSTDQSKLEDEKEVSLLSDSEMISYLNQHKADLDTLCAWIIKDKPEYMPPMGSDKANGNDRFTSQGISEERIAAYEELMKKISLELIVYPVKYQHNSIVFYLPVKKEGEMSFNKGFEYKIDTSKQNQDWIFTEKDILEEAKNCDRNTFVSKSVNEYWSLIALIQ